MSQNLDPKFLKNLSKVVQKVPKNQFQNLLKKTNYVSHTPITSLTHQLHLSHTPITSQKITSGEHPSDEEMFYNMHVAGQSGDVFEAICNEKCPEHGRDGFPNPEVCESFICPRLRQCVVHDDQAGIVI